MQTHPGTFVAIEGIDGSGKSIQIRLLAEKLQREGYEVETLDFPQYNQPGSFFVRQYLSGVYGRTDQVSPYNASLFFALDRFEAMMNIRKALAEGKVVLANRFTGSNMAHQGAKFSHPEERRGFFIWADNLEFQLLGIPRPDKTIVLRIPVETAQKLIDDHGRTPHTASQLDVHEADPNHMKKAAEVYEDLCQLFPKDFQRIDCVRDNKLLPSEAIHDIIRNAVEPLLPIKPEKPAEETTEPPKSTPAVPAKAKQINVSKISRILANELRRLGIVDHEIIQSGKAPDYYTPDGLGDKLEQKYWDSLDKIMALFNEIVKGTSEYLERTKNLPPNVARLQALQSAQAVLPLAALTTAVLNVNDATFKKAVTNLLGSNYQEVLEFSQKVSGKKASQQSNTDLLSQIGQDYLPRNHAPSAQTLQLVSHSPRNELDLVPEILYAHSNLPLQTIKESVATWPIVRKQEAITAYTNVPASESDKILNNVTYSFDLLADQGLQNALVAAGARLETQELTPRHGYEIPAEIEAAGMGDTFETAVDCSLGLYNDLQGASKNEAALYTILLCHRQRCMATLSLRQIIALQNKPIGKQLALAIQEVHPLLANKITA